MTSDSSSPRRRASRWLALGAAFALAVVAALGYIVIQSAGAVTEDEVRAVVRAGLETEAAEGFVVTGRLTSALEGSSARRWRLRILDIETGRAEVGVRVPATMTYGFSLDDFDASSVRFLDGGVVQVALPPLSVFSVEPELEEAEVEIDVSGAGRLAPSLTERTIEQTLRRVRPALRERAETYLDTADAPRENSARALRRVLAPPLEAAGVDLSQVTFRFVLARGDTLDLDARGGGQRRTQPTE